MSEEDVKTPKKIEDFVDQIHLGKWERVMAQIPSNSIDMIITSPPYNVSLGIGNKNKKDAYEEHDDNLPYDKYLEWMEEFFYECNRVLKIGGRIGINIADAANGQITTHADFTHILKNIGLWKYKKQNSDIVPFQAITTIVWDKSQMGSSTAWGCYDKETRVLTKKGFKYFKDVNISTDKIATINPKNRNLEYHMASDKIEKPFSGKLIHFKNRTFDLMVTPNHNMIYKARKDNTWRIRQAKDCTDHELCFPQSHNGIQDAKCKTVFVLPKIEYPPRTKKSFVLKQKEEKIDMDNWLKFLGIFFTDGNVYAKNGNYRVSIYQKKTDYIKKIEQCLKKMPFKFTYKQQKNEYYCCSKQLSSYLLKYKTKNAISLPKFIDGVSIRQKRIFIEWLYMGDGTIRNNKLKKIYLMESDYANQTIRLMIECGYSISFKKRFPSSKVRFLNGKELKETKAGIIVNYKCSKNYRVLRKSVNLVDYNDNVYCLTVPNHIMIVERNGKISICGNSWQSPVQPSFPTQFEFILVFGKGSTRHEGDKSKITVSRDDFIRNSRALWTFPPETQMMKKYGHPAAFPEELPRRLIDQLTYAEDIILDPFSGAGTTCAVAKQMGRHYIGIEMTKRYHETSLQRVNGVPITQMVKIGNEEVIIPEWMGE